MRLEQVPLESLDELVEQLEDLRHDLGKYIRFETRFLPPDADAAALRAALRADLLQTRRRGDEIESAWALWRRLRPSLLDGDPGVTALDREVAALEEASLDGPPAALAAAAARAEAVALGCRTLHARARARLEALDG
jgi:hypothetical protein